MHQLSPYYVNAMFFSFKAGRNHLIRSGLRGVIILAVLVSMLASGVDVRPAYANKFGICGTMGLLE